MIRSPRSLLLWLSRWRRLKALPWSSSKCMQLSRSVSTRTEPDPMDSTEPIKYTASKAVAWKALYTATGRPIKEPPPWFEFWIIQASVFGFLIYFCVLREENDIDEVLKRPPEELINYQQTIQEKK